jgi:TrmH family RNA methyltransferase
VRRLRRLIQKRALRWSEGVCVIEGPDLVDAALDSGIEFEALYVDAGESQRPELAALASRAVEHGVRVFSLQSGVLEKIADAQTPQPVLAAVRFAVAEIASLESHGLVLILHDVRDPGNAGTIIRSADAAGVDAVVFTGKSVDPFNPKTLRATAGSAFHVPIAVGDLSAALDHFTAAGSRTFATVVHGGTSLREVDFTKPTVVVIGNEASGLDAEAMAICHETLTIPMAGRCESLNAGIAASLIAFEAMWQRQDTPATPPPPSL